tara:strand:- start:389 stop:1063 length:675 start_codon:yes stop_codon:yes gene_type:complete
MDSNVIHLFKHLLLSGDHKFFNRKNSTATNINTVYIGAGIDIDSIIKLPSNLKVACIDGQPYSEFGNRTSNISYNGFSRPNFIPDLLKNAEKYNLCIDLKSLTELYFYNNNTEITYYINTAVPDDLSHIKMNITNFTDLIVIGHDPHYHILNYTTARITFWGNQQTVYWCNDDDISPDDIHGVIYKLNTDKKIRKQFKSFNLLMNSGEYITFSDWDCFVNYTKK